MKGFLGFGDKMEGQGQSGLRGQGNYAVFILIFDRISAF